MDFIIQIDLGRVNTTTIDNNFAKLREHLLEVIFHSCHLRTGGVVDARTKACDYSFVFINDLILADSSGYLLIHSK